MTLCPLFFKAALRFRPTNPWLAVTNFSPTTNGPVSVSDPEAPAGYFYRLKVTRN